MSDPVPQPSHPSTPEIPRSSRGVLCPDCDRLNPADRPSCKYCSRPLFVACSACSSTNERVLSQCRKCGHALQKGVLSGLLGSEPDEVFSSSRWDGAPSGPMGKGTLCCKCEHLNPIDLERCERCGEGLHVDCPKCQKRNARVLMHCTSCRGRLHRKTHHEGGHHQTSRPEGAILGFFGAFSRPFPSLYRACGLCKMHSPESGGCAALRAVPRSPFRGLP